MGEIISCNACTGEVADQCRVNFQRVVNAAVKNADVHLSGELVPGFPLDLIGQDYRAGEPASEYDPFSESALEDSAKVHDLFVRGLISGQKTIGCELETAQIKQRLIMIQGQ